MYNVTVALSLYQRLYLYRSTKVDGEDVIRIAGMPEPSSICMNLLVRYPYEDRGFKPEEAKLRESGQRDLWTSAARRPSLRSVRGEVTFFNLLIQGNLEGG